MGDTWNLYRSLVLSGIISIGMCQSGRVLVTAHGDSALGQQKAQVRAVCFLGLQNTQHPLPRSLRQQATQIQEKKLLSDLYGPCQAPSISPGVRARSISKSCPTKPCVV